MVQQENNKKKEDKIQYNIREQTDFKSASEKKKNSINSYTR